MEQVGLEPGPIWDASAVGEGLACYAPHTFFLKLPFLSFSLLSFFLPSFSFFHLFFFSLFFSTPNSSCLLLVPSEGVFRNQDTCSVDPQLSSEETVKVTSPLGALYRQECSSTSCVTGHSWSCTSGPETNCPLPGLYCLSPSCCPARHTLSFLSLCTEQ